MVSLEYPVTICVHFFVAGQDHRSVYETEHMLTVPGREGRDDDNYSDSQASGTTITGPVVTKKYVLYHACLPNSK